MKWSNKGIKPWGITIFMVMCLFMTIACGKEGNPEAGTNRSEDLSVYVPETGELDLGEGSLKAVKEAEGNLYFLSEQTDTESRLSSGRLYQTEPGSGKLNEILFDLKEGAAVQAMYPDKMGNLVVLASCVSDESQTPDGPSGEYQLLTFDKAGTVVAEKNITEAVTGSGLRYIQDMEADEQGNTAIVGNDGEGGRIVLCLKPDGLATGIIPLEGIVIDLFVDIEGTFYVTVLKDSGMEVRKLDIGTNSAGFPLDLGIAKTPDNLLLGKGVTGSLISDGITVSECDFAAVKAKPLFKWLDSNLEGNRVFAFGSLTDGRIWAVTRVSGSAGAEKVQLHVMAVNPAGVTEEKTTLTYGALHMGHEMKSAILQFNKSSDKYQIEITEYGQEEEGRIRFNNDVSGGNCPDIIDLAYINFPLLAAKGIFEDLSSYMDGENGIPKSDYMENVLGAYAVEGKQYGMPAAFGIETLTGRAKDVGGKEGWSIEEMITFAESRPDTMLLEGNPSSVLSIIIGSNLNQFVNWSTGECYFNNDNFIKLLEYANTYEKSESDGRGKPEDVKSGKNLLVNNYFHAVAHVQTMEALFEEPIAFVGYPGAKGNGALLSSPAGCSMSARSGKKEGVWEFIQFLLSDEYQNGLVDGDYGFVMKIPVKKSAIDQMCEAEMEKEFYSDSYGEEIEIMKSAQWYYGDFVAEIGAATEEDVALFKDLIQGAGNIGRFSDPLYNIIIEEAEPYFAGQKTSKEAADIIQNRVQIYVNENR